MNKHMGHNDMDIIIYNAMHCVHNVERETQSEYDFNMSSCAHGRQLWPKHAFMKFSGSQVFA